MRQDCETLQIPTTSTSEYVLRKWFNTHPDRKLTGVIVTSYRYQGGVAAELVVTYLEPDTSGPPYRDQTTD